MKAERRHVLQQNSLARVIENLPVAARLYADKILLGIVLVLLVVVLIRWRVKANEQRVESASESLASARSSIRELSNTPPLGMADQLAQRRTQLRSEAEQAVEQAVNDAKPDDMQLRSEAMVARGDLYWNLANLPELPGATTQPMLRLPESNEELLSKAEQAYQHVLTNYPNQARERVAAMFGLAAIAENRHKWDDAADQYRAIKDMPNALTMYKNLADERLKLLNDIRNPMFVGSLSTKPAELTPLVMAPATQSATTQATTQPTTQPSAAPR